MLCRDDGGVSTFGPRRRQARPITRAVYARTLYKSPTPLQQQQTPTCRRQHSKERRKNFRFTVLSAPSRSCEWTAMRVCCNLHPATSQDMARTGKEVDLKADCGSLALVVPCPFLERVWVQDPDATMVMIGPENRVVVDEAGGNRCPGRTVTAAMVFGPSGRNPTCPGFGRRVTCERGPRKTVWTKGDQTRLGLARHTLDDVAKLSGSGNAGGGMAGRRSKIRR
ncbi:uncharacterized protein CCOS01_00672 [Colletotrichum costaricense]|uniref:Uncharacterized protein n=2 Tax=Colletotrichum acutatum species complex TaxID=2707335 RepID=A0AAJ0E873_9PEZI|nr:uncharacterized protein CCOS01_00672 [Colletotrichum costaricense]KAK1539358.1 hypothetical protein CCOS01_00672 [Colletotrichum costaricense]